MIRNDSVPDDREKIQYFRTLRQQRFDKGRAYLFNMLGRSLAVSQYHLCPLCDETLYNGEVLHKHHIIPYKNGGPTTFGNLVLLHAPCHMKVTFMNQEARSRYELFLKEYKNSHPNILAKFLRDAKKQGISTKDITENELQEVDSILAIVEEDMTDPL